MAIGNWLLGTVRKKLGNTVMYRRNSEQVTRSYVSQVKNPSTVAQRLQRICAATVSKAYSALSEIADHSFEGVPYGSQSQSRFLKINMDKFRRTIIDGGFDADPADAGNAVGKNAPFALVPNDYILSSGSLPNVDVDSIFFSTNPSTEQPSHSNFEVAAVMPANIANLTYQQIVDTLGLQQGDQLTFVAIYASKEADGEGSYRINATRNCWVKIARVILSPDDGVMSHTFATDTASGWGTVNHANQGNTGFVRFAAVANGKLQVSLYDSSTDTIDKQIVAAAVIVSRRNGTTWKRSNSSMYTLRSHQWQTGWQVDYGYTADAWSLFNAIESYTGTAVYTSSPYYLNHSNKVAEVASSGE